MSTQKRHQAGAPASQGGKFAADPKHEADTTLASAEKPFRDLGVTVNLTPFDRYDDEITPGSQIYTSAHGREVVLSVLDGELVAQIKVLDEESWLRSTRDDGDAPQLLAETLSDLVVNEQFAALTDNEGGRYDLRVVGTDVGADGNLHTDVAFSDEEGLWSEIEYNHGTGRIQVSRDGNTLDAGEAAQILEDTSHQFSHQAPWDSVFAIHASGLPTDDEVLPAEREAAKAVNDGPRYFSSTDALANIAQDARGPVHIQGADGQEFAVQRAYVDLEGDVVIEGRAGDWDEDTTVGATELVDIMDQATSARRAAGRPGPTLNFYTEDYTFERLDQARVDDHGYLIVNSAKS